MKTDSTRQVGYQPTIRAKELRNFRTKELSFPGTTVPWSKQFFFNLLILNIKTIRILPDNENNNIDVKLC